MRKMRSALEIAKGIVESDCQSPACKNKKGAFCYTHVVDAVTKAIQAERQEVERLEKENASLRRQAEIYRLETIRWKEAYEPLNEKHKTLQDKFDTLEAEITRLRESLKIAHDKFLYARDYLKSRMPVNPENELGNVLRGIEVCNEALASPSDDKDEQCQHGLVKSTCLTCYNDRIKPDDKGGKEGL